MTGMRLLPLFLLAILAVAAFIIVAGRGPGLWFGEAGAIFLVFAMVFALRPSPVPPLDEIKAERRSATGAMALAIGIGGISLLTSAISPPLALTLLVLAAGWVIFWWPRRMRINSLTTSIVINRDPALVFSFMSDFENVPKIWPVYETVEKMTEGPIGPGTRFRSRVRFGPPLTPEPVFQDGVEEIVHFEPPRMFSDRVVGQPRYHLGTTSFEPVDGGTRATRRFDSEVTYSAAVLGSRLFESSTNQRRLTMRRERWANAKAYLEALPE